MSSTPGIPSTSHRTWMTMGIMTRRDYLANTPTEKTLLLTVVVLVGIILVQRHAEISSDHPQFLTVPSEVPIQPLNLLNPNSPLWRPARLVDDDEMRGKTCRPVESRWQCRDCGLDYEFFQWQDCPLLERAHVCEDVQTVQYDSPLPRSSSFLGSADLLSTNRITYYGIKEMPGFQPPCSADLDDLCFNLTKCKHSGLQTNEGPMDVFPHGVKAERYLSLALEWYPNSVRRVTDPSEACLIVVSCSSSNKTSSQELWNTPTWNSGMNHFIWRSNTCFGSIPDRPIGRVSYGVASLASPSFTDAMVRKGYDVPTAYTKFFTVPFDIPSLVMQTMGQNRKWLVSFKGNICTNHPEVWWQHRWLAANYWNGTDPTVAIDVTCDKMTNYSDKYPDYVNLLMNSTFVFCPGGGSPQSFRFMEALALGAIPVVTPDLLTPFHPHLDWTGCVVRVSVRRIIDLPRLLGEISPEEVRLRQKRCLELFEMTLGWTPNPNTNQSWIIDAEGRSFVISMRIWSWRIRNALQKQQDLKYMEMQLS